MVPTRLSIITCNIWLTERWPARAPALERFLTLFVPDILCVQELQRPTQEFLDRLTDFLRFALPQYVEEGKSYLTVAIGCTGGRHRSVMLAEAVKKGLKDVPGVRLRVQHRDS